jgi:hypothetical protein
MKRLLMVPAAVGPCFSPPVRGDKKPERKFDPNHLKQFERLTGQLETALHSIPKADRILRSFNRTIQGRVGLGESSRTGSTERPQRICSDRNQTRIAAWLEFWEAAAGQILGAQFFPRLSREWT